MAENITKNNSISGKIKEIEIRLMEKKEKQMLGK